MKTRLLALTAAVMLTFGILSGCGEVTEEPVREKLEHVWRSTEIELDESEGEKQILSIVPSGDEAVLLTVEYFDGGERKYSLVTLDLETLETNEQPVTGVEGSVNGIAAYDDGLLLLVSSFDTETQQSNDALYKTRDGAAELFCDDIGRLFDTKDSNMLSNLQIRDIATSGSNIYIAAEGSAIALDSELNKLYEVVYPDGFGSISETADGEVYICYYDYGGRSRERIQKLDDSVRGFGDEIILPENSVYQNPDIYFASGYDVYIDSDNALLGYNAADGEPVEVCNWINSNIIRPEVRGVFMLDSERMLTSSLKTVRVSPDVTRLECELFLLERVPDDELPEYYIIDLAINNQSYDLSRFIVEFNRQSEDYRVVLTAWSERDGEISGAEQLSREIIAGNTPDIIFTSGFYDEAASWFEQGLFCDLYELMDDDESFDESRYNMDILRLYEDDGKLMRFVTGYSMNTLIARRGNVPDDGWTVEEFLDWAESLPDDALLMPFRPNILWTVLTSALDEFVDYKTGRCSFDGELFGRLLELEREFMNRPDKNELYGEDKSNMELYRSNKLMLNNAYFINDIASLFSNIYLVADDIDDVVMVGYPTSDGNGMLIQARESISICKDSLVRDGAWEFIKYYSSHSDDELRINGLPTSYDSLDLIIGSETGYYYLFQENTYSGSSIQMTDEQLANELRRKPGVYHRVSDEDYDYLLSLTRDARLQSGENALGTEIMNIIDEETAMYFAGEKSLAETQELIQNRVSLLVSERS